MYFQYFRINSNYIDIINIIKKPVLKLVKISMIISENIEGGKCLKIPD